MTQKNSSKMISVMHLICFRISDRVCKKSRTMPALLYG
jgi:hypothetical protein